MDHLRGQQHLVGRGAGPGEPELVVDQAEIRVARHALGADPVRDNAFGDHRLDGIVALGNCDKTVPAYLMTLASADIPALIVTGGYRVPAVFHGAPLGSGTALWRAFDAAQRGA